MPLVSRTRAVPRGETDAPGIAGGRPVPGGTSGSGVNEVPERPLGPRSHARPRGGGHPRRGPPLARSAVDSLVGLPTTRARPEAFAMPRASRPQTDRQAAATALDGGAGLGPEPDPSHPHPRPPGALLPYWTRRDAGRAGVTGFLRPRSARSGRRSTTPPGRPHRRAGAATPTAASRRWNLPWLKWLAGRDGGGVRGTDASFSAASKDWPLGSTS